MENTPKEKPRRYAETLRHVMAMPSKESQSRYIAQAFANQAISELPLDLLAEWFTRLADGLACHVKQTEVSGQQRPKTGVSEMTMVVEESPELRTARIEIRSLEAELAKQVDEVAHARQRADASAEELERLRKAGVDGRVREAEFGKATRLFVHSLVDDLTDNQLVEICKKIPADACYHDRVMRCLGDVCCIRFKDESEDDEDQEIEKAGHVCSAGCGGDRSADTPDA